MHIYEGGCFIYFEALLLVIDYIRYMICISIFTYTYIHVHIHNLIHTHIYIYIYIYIYTNTYIHVPIGRPVARNIYHGERPHVQW